MQKVILLGEMGQKFGETWDMNVDYLGDIFKLIACQRNGFKKYLTECQESGTDFAIKRGKEYVGEEELLLSVADEDIIITAVPAGAKSGFAKILAAIVIIVVTWGWGASAAAAANAQAGVAAGSAGAASAGSMIAGNIFAMTAFSMGMGLAMQGISQLMMPGPEVDKETPDNYLFNGSSAHIKEGLPVPLIYGEMLVGGGVINQTLTTRRITAGGSGGSFPQNRATNSNQRGPS